MAARSAVNRKVGGSSPPGGEKLFFFFEYEELPGMPCSSSQFSVLVDKVSIGSKTRCTKQIALLRHEYTVSQ
jgi:hypothetical protein